MVTWSELEAAVARRLSGKRLAHVQRVVGTARGLSRLHDVSLEKAEVAALLHDYAKQLPDAELLALARRHDLIIDPAEEQQPQLLHGPVAAELVRSEGLADDPQVLQAIRWHSTGRAGMGRLEMLIWLADYVEPGRAFPGVELVRSRAQVDLEGALLIALDQTIHHVLERGWLLHSASVQARNWLLSQRITRANASEARGSH